MAFTVAQVIAAARAKHATFVEERYPDKVAFEALRTFVDRMVLEGARVNREPFLLSESWALPLATFATGVALSVAYSAIESFEALRASDGRWVPVELQHRSSRFADAPNYTVYQQGSSFLLRGLAEHWTGLSQLRAWYLPRCPTITVDTFEIPMPDYTRAACEAAVARAFAALYEGTSEVPPVNLGRFSDELVAAEAELRAALGMQGKGKVFRRRDVMS